MSSSTEQIDSPQHVDQRSDLYSLGINLYRAVTGRTPFESNSHFALMMAHVRQQPTPPSLYRSDIPPALEDLIADALEKRPDDRPQTCSEFRERLVAALSGLASTQPALAREPQEPLLIGPDGSELVLVEAGEVAETSRFLKDTLGEDVHRKLVETKLSEADKFRLHVSDLDLKDHLVL